ncbi:lysine acetyltransferase [Achaetomium macrosporum]|uniref:Lysine acetyltransferase n=1 Tax=Achaetomium macrosporum TaxID=79813 RepID=A0AAN7C8B1_9PEZI|nr:lysine acetyltransferase [Achaetomium macrosporum]
MAQPMGLTASDIVFSEATPEQRELAWELCGQTWAAPMSLEDYVERERHLAQHDLNRDGRCRYWVLYLKGYPRHIIASCEATRKPILISDGGGRPARTSNGYAVTNIYTNPTYRRQGMASYLLRRVQEQMDADSDCSVLYSDSGRSYYASLGWSPFGSRQATLTLLPSSSSPSHASQNRNRTRLLEMSDLPDLCEADVHHLTKSFNSLPADGKTRVAFLPTLPQISWHLSRAEFDARKILPLTGNLRLAKGAMVLNNSSNGNSKSWITWAHDWREKRLRILRISRVCQDQAQVTLRTQEELMRDVAALLDAAVGEARRWGLCKVIAWNPDEEVRTACKRVGNAYPGPEGVKVMFEERIEGGMPSLRWSEGRVVKDVAWEENFGFCWC